MITFKEWKNQAQYFNYKNHDIAYWTATIDTWLPHRLLGLA